MPNTQFTDRVRKVLQLANQEAQRFNHEYVGPEHLLLGIIKEGSGIAAYVLGDFDVDLRKVRYEVEKLVRTGPDTVTMGRLPQTPRTRKVLEYAMEESRNRNHAYTGTEHILLGLLREAEGVAAQVLLNLGLALEEIRCEVLKNLVLKPEEHRCITPAEKQKKDDPIEAEALLIAKEIKEWHKWQMRVIQEHFSTVIRLASDLAMRARELQDEVDNVVEQIADL
jgi:ATP-dependent Clp protease ATP-binding subunit ClpA